MGSKKSRSKRKKVGGKRSPPLRHTLDVMYVQPQAESQSIQEDESRQEDNTSSPFFLQILARLTTWQVSLAFLVLGLVVFAAGLNSPFLGDDIDQIVENPVVHSLKHIPILFNGSTFYNGGGIAPLDGSFYRPLMSTVFALLYSIDGANPVVFHTFQLALHIGGAILLYLILRRIIKNSIAVVMSLIFLVHPINSQIVFSAASMNDGLFVFFGLLGLATMIYKKSVGSLVFVSLCILLSLLSKEAALLFIPIMMLYIFWFDKDRLKPFIIAVSAPVVLYIILRVHALHGLTAPINTPSAQYGFLDRLVNAPSVVAFYFEKFLFPIKLSSSYDWMHNSLSFKYTIIPLVVIGLVITGLVYAGKAVRDSNPKNIFYIYLFFATWLALAAAIYSKVLFPLARTANEIWFYFMSVAILAIIGLTINNIRNKATLNTVMVTLLVLAVVFSGRTIARASDWQNTNKLAKSDLSASSENHSAYNSLAVDALNKGDYENAAKYAQKSIDAQPGYINYYNLGFALSNMGKYNEALAAYQKGMSYGDYDQLYEAYGTLLLLSKEYGKSEQYFDKALGIFPKSSKLWAYRALIEAKQGKYDAATTSIDNAAKFGDIPPQLVQNIKTKATFYTNIPNTPQAVFNIP